MSVARGLAYFRARVTGLAVCRLPAALRWYVITVITAAAAATLTAAALTSWRIHDVLLFAALAFFGAAVVELTRRTTEPSGHIKDVHGIWLLPIALLLPPVYCLAAPAITFALLQLRTRSTIVHRQVFSAASQALALAAASAAAGLMRSRLPWLNPGLAGQTMRWLAAAAGCALLWSALSQGLVITAVVLSDPKVRVRTRLLACEPLLLDVCELGAGLVLTAAIATASSVVLLPALPLVVVLQRSFRHAQLVAATRIDTKTGLLNAAVWPDEATVALARAQRTGSPLAVVITELDQFRTIRDEYGREAADAVIEGTAAVVRTGLRPGDLIGRYTDGEFVLLLPGVDASGAVQVADRLRANLADQLIPAGPGHEPLYVTMSIGIAATEEPSSRDLTDLLTSAEYALCRATRAGRDRVRLAPGSADVAELSGGDAVGESEDDLAGSDLDDREDLLAARQALGQQLKAWREQAKMSQTALARRIGSSRSAVAGAEAGKSRKGTWWAATDHAVRAGGALVAQRARIEAARVVNRRRAARQALAVSDPATPCVASAMPEDGEVAVIRTVCQNCGEPTTWAARVIPVPIPQITANHRARQRPR
jgi:diguanylate cyclase (GGDEF)-like protein